MTPLPSITDRISTPVRLASDPLGNIYLTDPRAGGILKFTNSGKYLATISTPKPPQGIAVTASGDLVVGQGSTVSVLSGSGTFKYQLSGTFLMANGIALDAVGNIYVVDSLANCVKLFSASGVPLNVPSAAPGMPVNSFGSSGAGSGQLSRPTGIAFEKVSGQLAVVDTLNNRVQFFTPDGVPVRSIGSSGAGGLHFGSPEGVAFSYGTSGNLMYVVDAFQSNVQVIDLSAGAFLRVIGSYGTGGGKLVVPSDVLFDGLDPRNQRIIVANGFGNLSLFGIDSTVPAQSGGGPLLSIDSVPLATNITSLTLSGSVSAGAQVSISVSTSASVGAVSYPAPGVWSAPVTSLPPGSNLFTVTAVDNLGRKSTMTAGTTVLASGGTVTPLTVKPLPSLTSIAAQTLSGTVAPGSSVSVNGAAATVSAGAWSFAATLSPGSNTFLITAVNPSYGDATASLNVVLDNAPPLVALSMLPDGSVSSSQVLSVSGVVADASAVTVNLRLNGQALPLVPVINGTFSAAVLMSRGSNTVVVSATDAAGNQSAEITRSCHFNPSAPDIIIDASDMGASAGASIPLSGLATQGSAVTVNGVAASVSAGRWSGSATLAPGLNTVVACATQGGAGSCAKLTVIYDPALPALSVTMPQRDIAYAAGQGISIAGSSGGRVTLSATFDGTPATVKIAADNSFTISLPTPSLGSHTLAVSAVDAFGSTLTSIRGVLVADAAPPQLVVSSVSPVQVSVGGGAVLSVKDKNGPVGNVVVNGATSSVDLTGVVYDPASLTITATTPAGVSSRNGVLVETELASQVNVPTVGDAVEGLKIAVGVKGATFSQQLHGDVAPLGGGVSFPDGNIGIDDVLAIMRRGIGLPW